MQRIISAIAIFLLLLLLLTSCAADGDAAAVGEPAEKLASSEAVNINSAEVEELRRIPSIGEKIALKIVEFRAKHGPFRRIEHLLLIDGVSDRRFREIRYLVRVE